MVKFTLFNGTLIRAKTRKILTFEKSGVNQEILIIRSSSLANCTVNITEYFNENCTGNPDASIIHCF